MLSVSADLRPDNAVGPVADGTAPQTRAAEWERIGGVPMYAIDALARRAHALQLTPDAWGGEVRLSPTAATALGIDGEAFRGPANRQKAQHDFQGQERHQKAHQHQ